VLSRLVTRGTEITVEMTTLRQNRSTLLERVRTEQRLQERALKEMHMAKADLDRTLKTVQTKRGEAAKGFLQSKGKLSAPVAGEIIRSFGEKRIVDNHAFKETGIAIIAAHGAPIKAVYPGEVVFAGYERGFGNMVIIDHGMRQYTVTARLGKILVKEGDKVAAGSLIARAGDIASLLEDGVHFEIRDGSEPQDPLDWLDDSGLSFSP
jgi:septal ring factor EnvC (AmiA/AmiB activator)